VCCVLCVLQQTDNTVPREPNAISTQDSHHHLRFIVRFTVFSCMLTGRIVKSDEVMSRLGKWRRVQIFTGFVVHIQLSSHHKRIERVSRQRCYADKLTWMCNGAFDVVPYDFHNHWDFMLVASAFPNKRPRFSFSTAPNLLPRKRMERDLKLIGMQQTCSKRI